MIAEEAGLDGRALAKAGQAAHATLRMLRAATRAPSAAQRKRLAERAKAALAEIKARDLSADARRALTEQVTAKVQELSGGAEPRTPSVNPETGLQEFASPMVMRPGMPKGEMRDWLYRPGIDPAPEMRNLPYNPEVDGPPEWSLLGAQTSRGLLNPNAGTPSGGLLNTSPPPATPEPHTPAPPAKMPPLPRRRPKDLADMITLPVPGGTERNDSAGMGWYRADRGQNKDGDPRFHEGVDMLVDSPGDPVYAPIDGTFEKPGLPYDPKTWPDRAYYRIVNIRGQGPYDGLKFRMFYVDPASTEVGSTVRRGDVIGHYQDIKAAYPDSKSMQHHVHVETLYDDKKVDPAQFLPRWKSQKP
jgi:murein DD-endopeptidase MepM/ murein hydrolase activator NlpD